MSWWDSPAATAPTTLASNSPPNLRAAIFLRSKPGQGGDPLTGWSIVADFEAEETGWLYQDFCGVGDFDRSGNIIGPGRGPDRHPIS